MDKLNTKLRNAVKAGSIKMAQKALDAGADISIKTRQGETLAHLAAEKGYVECLGFLIDSGVDIKVAGHLGRTALHVAAANGHQDCIKELLGLDAEINQIDDHKNTPLIAVCYNSHGNYQRYFECLKYLVDKGASVNIKDSSGFTALSIMTSKDCYDSVRYLVEHGADIHAGVKGGDNLLHSAAWTGRFEAFSYLMNFGLDPLKANDSGVTPLGKAKIYGNQEGQQKIISIIEAYAEQKRLNDMIDPESCCLPKEMEF